MGRLENLQKLKETREKFEQLKVLKKRCFEIFETHAGVSAEFIETTINNEWPKLYRIVHISNCKYDINMLLIGMKNFEIDRSDFKKMMSDQISKIEKRYADWEKELADAEKQVSDDYDSFFQNASPERQKGAPKYIFWFFNQPEVKKIILNYLMG